MIAPNTFTGDGPMVEGQVRDDQWAVLDCVSVSTNSFHPRLLALII